MRWILVIVLVVWLLAVVAWVRANGAPSFLKLAGVLAAGAAIALVGFLLLDLVWWAIGGVAAMLAGMGMVFGVVYWIDRRKVKAYEENA